MKCLSRFVLVSFFLYSLSHSQAAIDREFLIAPYTPMTDGDSGGDDAFEQCPVYRIEQPRQVIQHAGWGGEADFAASVRLRWDDNAIHLRFDITDDQAQPATEEDGSNGDHIRINMAHLTRGPDRDSRSPWSIVLLPDPDNETCDYAIQAASNIDRAKIGAAECVLTRTGDGYSVICSLANNTWDDPPRESGLTRIQITYQDIDDSDKMPHRFALFPVPRTVANQGSRYRTAGKIRFARDYWVQVHPSAAVFGDHTVTLFLDGGNLTKEQLSATIKLERREHKAGGRIDDTIDDAQDDDSASSEQRVSVELPAASARQDIKVEFDMNGLESGRYRVKARSGLYFDTGSFDLAYDANSGLTYVPSMVEERPKVKRRKLAMYGYRTREGNAVKTIKRDLLTLKETYRFMAGGGKVLWHQGMYDATSRDFPQYVRKVGPHTVVLPEATDRDIPWALFGGLDPLDGTNEPLVIKLDDTFARSGEPLVPEQAITEEGRVLKGRSKAQIKRLMLLGVNTEYVDEDSFPELHVYTDDTTLLKETIRPTDVGGPGKRHAFVYRVWLEGKDREIKIENSALYGGKFEIDFIAFLGGGNPTTFGFEQPSVVFEGTPEAERFGKQIVTSLFFMQHYLVDRYGRAHFSLPGGRYDDTDMRNNAMLMNELVHWGAMKEAQTLLQPVARYHTAKQAIRQPGKMTITDPLLITALFNVWRKLGKPTDLIEKLWVPAVQQPMLSIINEISASPLGQPSARGEFGVDDAERTGTTVPVHFATRAALGAALSIAEDTGSDTLEWKRQQEPYVNTFSKLLVSPENSFQINSNALFSDKFGLGDEYGIAQELPHNVWLYGRFEDETPVLYNRGFRAFDTPILLSGIALWLDYNGFDLDPATDAQLQATYDYLLRFSPVFARDSWRHRYLVDYKNSTLQNWTIIAGLLLDSPIAGQALKSIIRHTFDEELPLPQLGAERSDIEISPYTFEEKLNVSSSGETLGGTFDDLNVMNGVNSLKMARVIMGIDDYDSDVLKLTPRLPEDWQKVEVDRWVVSHDFDERSIEPIYFNYQKVAYQRYRLVLLCDQTFKAVKIRVGPFSERTRKVRLTVKDGPRADVKTFSHGSGRWAEHTYTNVKSPLNVSVQAISY